MKKYFQPILKDEIYWQHIFKYLQAQVGVMRDLRGGQEQDVLLLLFMMQTRICCWIWVGLQGFFWVWVTIFIVTGRDKSFFVSVKFHCKVVEFVSLKMEELCLYWSAGQQLSLCEVFIIDYQVYWRVCSETCPIINTISYLVIRLWVFSCGDVGLRQTQHQNKSFVRRKGVCSIWSWFWFIPELRCCFGKCILFRSLTLTL